MAISIVACKIVLIMVLIMSSYVSLDYPDYLKQIGEKPDRIDKVIILSVRLMVIIFSFLLIIL